MDQNIKDIDKGDRRETSCFTYEVNLVVQILATDKKEADEKLDRDGGYISKRVVTFKDAVALYSGEPFPAAETPETDSKD